MKKIYNIKVSTLLIVFLPILSILIGYFGVKLYLLSNNNYNDEIDVNKPGVEEIIEEQVEGSQESSDPSENDNSDADTNETTDSEKKTTNRINSINFYSIQVGSFSNIENAEEFKTDFKEKGYYSFKLEDNNFKVFVNASFDKEVLQETLDEITEISPDAFIKRIDLQSRNFSYVVKEKDYFIETGDLIANLFNEESIAMNQSSIEKQLTQIEKSNASFLEVDSSNENIGKRVKNYVSEYRENILSMINGNDDSSDLLLKKNITLFINNFR